MLNKNSFNQTASLKKRITANKPGLNKKLLLTSLLLMLIFNMTSAEETVKPDTSNISDNTETSIIADNTETAEKGETSPSINIISPDQLLGLTPSNAYLKLGSPEEVFSMRGESEWQDDVVFYYKNHIYLFWFKNRVWQFRADKRFTGTVLGLKQGSSRKEVNKIMGKPFKSEEGTEIYLNPKSITRYETGFPVRMKVFYDDDNTITDIYVYRGDF